MTLWDLRLHLGFGGRVLRQKGVEPFASWLPFHPLWMEIRRPRELYVNHSAERKANRPAEELRPLATLQGHVWAALKSLPCVLHPARCKAPTVWSGAE